MPNTWCIYHVENSSHTIFHGTPTPMNKFVAIVCKDSDYRGFYINSKIRLFIKERQELLQCQVKIKVSHYRFLDDDSYINCQKTYPFRDDELFNYKCNINIVTKAEIQKAVKDSGLIEGRWEKLILSGS